MADLNDYYWFALVVQHGGFSAAERATEIPKSKLSRRIQQLETDLGVRLIQRTSRHFVVTDVGMNVYRHAQSMMMEAQAAQDAVAQLRAEPRGVIRVSVPVDVAQQQFAQILPAFLKRYPEIKVQLIVSNRRVDIINESIDVALRIRDKLDNDASYIVRRFGQMKHLLVASTAYLNQHGRPETPEALAQHDTLNMVEDEAHQYWELHSPAGELNRVKINPRITGSNLSMLLNFAVEGMGIALLPESTCAAQVHSGQLEVVLAGWEAPLGTFHAVYASKRGVLPAVRVFIDYLVEELPPLLKKYEIQHCIEKHGAKI
jgi:DNA-binding transcriptional LysR family regulator